MRRTYTALLWCGIALALMAGGQDVDGDPALAPAAGGVVEYQSICNASAAVGLTGGRFLVAADEDNPTTFLRVYREGHPEGPVASLPLPNDALDPDPDEDLEVDIEGAARVGDRVYWISSHSANKDGKPRPNRRRLFATRVDEDGAEVRVPT
jgi:hypothetical protein